MKRKTVSKLGIVMVAVVLITGCGASKATESAVQNGMTTDSMYEGNYEFTTEESIEAEAEQSEEGYSEESVEEKAEASKEAEATVQSQRKLIKTVEIDLETLEYEKTIGYIENKVSKLGGYIENSNLEGSGIYSDYGNRYAELKVRIPKEKTEEFVEGIDETTNVRRKSETTEDITLNYVDVESHKEALKVEQERLMAILQKAETVEEIISLESRLSEVRYELNGYESRLRIYDNLVDYTTITLSVSEVEEITEPPKLTALERMGEGFVDSVKDILSSAKEFVIGFVIAIPYFVVWGVVIVSVIIIVKKILKSRKKKKEALEKQE